MKELPVKPSPEGAGAYRGPQLIDVGAVTAVTGAIGSPVRDNPLSDHPAYYDANPPPKKLDPADLD